MSSDEIQANVPSAPSDCSAAGVESAPISRKDYESKTESFWKGKKVVSLTPLENGVATLPAGTGFTVTRKFNGLFLQSDPCECCGISLRITYAPHWKLTLQT